MSGYKELYLMNQKSLEDVVDMMDVKIEKLTTAIEVLKKRVHCNCTGNLHFRKHDCKGCLALKQVEEITK